MADALRQAHPDLVVEELIVRTRGEVLADVPLHQIGGQGVFVKEIQAAVLEGRADIAVHSAKDLPSITPPGLVIAAVPVREDPRDALVGRALAELPPGAVVATGSARRRAQLAGMRPDLTFAELRGNMDTRLRRAEDGSVHAVVVAVAALRRLGQGARVTDVLDPDVLLPQAGQGALALECRADDEQTASMLAGLDDELSHRCLVAERAVLAGIGGDCSLPIAAWAAPAGPPGFAGSAGPGLELQLRGLVSSGDGKIQVRAESTGIDPEQLGRTVAERLLVDGGAGAIEGALDGAVDGPTGGPIGGPPGGLTGGPPDGPTGGPAPAAPGAS